jgi:hypothetical protein
MSITVLLVLFLIQPHPPAVTHSVVSPSRPVATSVDTQRTWSNDDVNFLREHAPISIVGVVLPPASAPAVNKPVATPLPYVKENDPNWYEAQISSRRAQIGQIDSQLAHIASVGQTQDTSDAFPLTGSSPGILLPGTQYVLQQEKSQLEAEISDLQDLAQANQITRSAWR